MARFRPASIIHHAEAVLHFIFALTSKQKVSLSGDEAYLNRLENKAARELKNNNNLEMTSRGFFSPFFWPPFCRHFQPAKSVA